MKKQLSMTTGLHILGDIYVKDVAPLKSGGRKEVKKMISATIKKYGLQELGSFYYQFPKAGFTGIVSLVESHVAIHTWPEFGYLTLDVYVCNYSRDNTDRCKKVFNEIARFFKPVKIKKTLVKR